MFQYIVYSIANRQGLLVYVRTCKTRLDTTTKFMVVVTSLFNLVMSSLPDNMYHHAWTWLSVDLSWWFQQRCSSLFVHQAMNSLFQHASASITSLSTTMFKLASSTMFKPVNRQKQAVRFYVCSSRVRVSHRSSGCCEFNSHKFLELAKRLSIANKNRCRNVVSAE